MNRLQINLNGGQLTRRELYRHALAQTKIVAVDPRFRGQTCTRIHHRALAMIGDIEDDWFRHPEQGQVPRHFVVLATDMSDIRTLEDDRGILLYGKEGRRTQVG